MFYYTSKHRLRTVMPLWMMIGLLGLATAIAIPLLNKLASKIGVAYMPALVFLIVTVALSLLVHTTTVLSKHQEIIKNSGSGKCVYEQGNQGFKG
ncbi:DUF2304 family protein [Paenibacillus larvae]|nr:DUF2304 family protein [Paenibacillus larvae]